MRMTADGSVVPQIGDWLPAPIGDRAQHRLGWIQRDFPQLVSSCRLPVVTYPTDDTRVPWTTWPKCPDCLRLAAGNRESRSTP